MATVMPLPEADLPPTSFFDRTGADLSGLVAPAGVHPAATLLPAMRPEDLELLRRSLDAGWKAECPPILVDRRHRVIDGRHRVELLGVPIERLIADGRARVVGWDDDAIVGYVLAANLARRQLSLDERRALYGRLTAIFGTRPPGRPGRRRAEKGSAEPLAPPPSRAERARLGGISVATAKRLDAEARRPTAGGRGGARRPAAAAKAEPVGRPGAEAEPAATAAAEDPGRAPTAAPAQAERERRQAALTLTAVAAHARDQTATGPEAARWALIKWACEAALDRVRAASRAL